MPKPKAETGAQGGALARIDAAYAEARQQRFDYVLKHWVGRLEKHGLPGSADGAKLLARRIGDMPDGQRRDEQWWIDLARGLGGDLGGELAIGYVREVMIELMENDRAGIAGRNRTR
jgi:hypothetical protein